jgi:hypothetical protein
MFHMNRKHHENDIYAVSDRVYLSTQNLTLPKGRARKLVTQYIGPYHVIKAHNMASTVTLELPEDLKNRCMLLSFHTNLVRQYIANNDDLSPRGEAKSFYDVGGVMTRNGSSMRSSLIDK